MSTQSNDLFEHVQREEKRLERIEAKIDKLSDAMIDLARAEVKLVNIEKASAMSFDRMNKHSERMTEIEEKLQEQGKVVKVMQFILSVGSTVIVGAALKIFFDK